MAIKLASLFIEIAADGGKLTAELKKTSKQAKDWSKKIDVIGESVKKSFSIVAVSAGLATVAMTALYVSNAKQLDRLGKLAAQLDDQAGSIRVLGVAAEYAGVGAESMYKNLERMTRRLGDAADGAGPAADAIGSLGLSMDDLLQLRPTQAFEAIAGALEGIESPAQRASIAAALFGKDGLKALNLTTDVLRQARSDVEALGGALTNLEIAQIESANDSVFRLGLGVDLLSERFTAKLAPAVNAVAVNLFESSTQAQQLQGAMNNMLDSAIVGVGDFAVATGRIFKFVDGRPELAAGGMIGYLLGGKLGFLAGAVAASTFESFGASFDYYKSRFDLTLSDAERAEIALKKVVARMNLLNTPGIGSLVIGADDELVELEKQRRAVVTILSDMGEYDRITGVLFRNSESALNALGETLINIGGDISRTVTDLDTQVLTSPATPGIVIGDSSQDDSGTTKENAEKELRDSYFSQRLSDEKTFQDTWTLFQKSGSKDRLSILKTETSSALASLAQHSRTMFEINKAVGLGNAGIYIAEGIAAAWKLGWPLGAPAAATVALNGAAQIKAITGAKYGSATVASPTAGSSVAPITSVGSVNSSAAAANDSTLSNEIQSSGGLFAVFTSAGASDEQRADEVAQAMKIAQDNDIMVPNANGGLDYTGSGVSSYTSPAWSQTA
jgi:hypothetical protein